MVTMSTVGYGDLSPTTAGSRVFTIFFIAVGLIVVFSQIAIVVSSCSDRLFQKVRDRLEIAFPRRGFDIDGNGKFDYHIPGPRNLFYTKASAPSDDGRIH